MDKNRIEAEQTLISQLYQCIGERGKVELHNRKQHLDLSTTWYPRILDETEGIVQKKRNETLNLPIVVAQTTGSRISRAVSLGTKRVSGKM